MLPYPYQVVMGMVDNKIGTLRSVYYNSAGERVVVNSNIGYVDYDNGIVNISDTLIVDVNTTDKILKVSCPVNTGIITSSKNSIVTIDENDTNSINITLNTI